MSTMQVKNDLISCVHESLGSVASIVFLKRASSLIEAAPDDKESLWEASCKVSRLTELFIDEGLAEQIRERLRTRIEGD
jgi:hypothetical protein